jgi:hypothetical protein
MVTQNTRQWIWVGFGLFVLAVTACTGGESSDSASSSDDSCTTSISSSAPTWIKDNFKCVTVTASGSSVVFNTSDVPNYNSYYFGSSDSRYEDIPSGHHGNPNTISEQNYTFTTPTSPALNSSVTASDYDAVGIAVNGVVIYNNQAAPGDVLATELATMDSANGHPTQTGSYHYHSEPYKITNDDGNLVGVMRDGFPIYGQKEDDGSDPVYNDSCTPATANSVTNCRPFPTDMPNFHCHATTLFPGGICHYHVITSDPYIIENYAGTAGTMSNN